MKTKNTMQSTMAEWTDFAQEGWERGCLPYRQDMGVPQIFWNKFQGGTCTKILFCGKVVTISLLRVAVFLQKQHIISCHIVFANILKCTTIAPSVDLWLYEESSTSSTPVFWFVFLPCSSYCFEYWGAHLINLCTICLLSQSQTLCGMLQAFLAEQPKRYKNIFLTTKRYIYNK